MKQFLVLLLCSALLLMVACSVQTEKNPGFEGSIIQDDSLSLPNTTPAEPSRVNPPSQRAEEAIAVFGNVPGIVAGASEEEDLPNRYKDGNRIVFNSDKITFIAEKGTYLVDGYVEKAERLLQVMEDSTGLSFSPAPLSLYLMDAGNRHSDYDYAGGVDAEHRMVQIGQGDGFLGNSYELITYAAFVLQWDNAPQSFNSVLTNGFATYTTYKVLSWLEKNDPAFGSAFSGKHSVYSNYYLYDPDTLYSQPITYWMENEYPIGASNGDAAVGFWLMAYLDTACEGYTKWITDYDDSQGSLDQSGQLQLLKDVYGDAVLEDFYPWLRENLANVHGWDMVPDRTTLHAFSCYPLLTAWDVPQELFYGPYADICVSLAEYRHYLTQVKEYTVSEITLTKYTDAEVLLYDENGMFLMATKGTESPDGAYLVYLDDACYFRIPEEGFLHAMLSFTRTDS